MATPTGDILQLSPGDKKYSTIKTFQEMLLGGQFSLFRMS